MGATPLLMEITCRNPRSRADPLIRRSPPIWSGFHRVTPDKERYFDRGIARLRPPSQNHNCIRSNSRKLWKIGIMFCQRTSSRRRTQVQGISKRWGPGCVKMRWNSCIILPVVGKQNTTFWPNLTQPGAHLLEIPSRRAGVVFRQQTKFATHSKLIAILYGPCRFQKCNFYWNCIASEFCSIETWQHCHFSTDIWM